MGENTPNIDSRYSPIYQRGGTGSPDAHESRWPSPGEPQQQRSNTLPEAPAQHPVPVDSAAVVEVMPDGSGASDSTASERPRRNPFVLALWLLGAALLALGLWAVLAPLQANEAAINGGPFPQWIFIISQSAGGIMVSGSILIAAAGALSAVFWDRGRR